MTILNPIANANQQDNKDIKCTNLIYYLIASLFIIPLLIPFSYFPVSKFYSELAAVVIANCIGIMVIINTKTIRFSVITIACGLFAIFLLLQPLFIPIRLPGINIFVAIEFITATMLSIGITSFIDNDHHKQQHFVYIICAIIAFTTMIQVIIGLLQYTTLASYFADIIFYVNNSPDNIFGNIGQKNDYVDFVTMGIFAFAYLYFIKRIKLSTYSFIIFLYLFIVSIAASRTVFIYFIFALVIISVFFYFNRLNNNFLKNTNKQLFLLITSLLLVIIVIQILLPLINHITNTTSVIPVGIERFGSNNIGQTTYRRFYEWYKQIIIFIDHPILGIGWYQYPKAAIDIMLHDARFWYIPQNGALYTHSHNSLFNILAETGLLGFSIIVIYGFIYSIYTMGKYFNNYATLFILCIIFTIFGQSLLQYPLWYAYFFMWFVCLLSINQAVLSFNNNKMIKAVFMIIFIALTSICFNNYQKYNELLNYTTSVRDVNQYNNNIYRLKEMVDNDLLWQLPALMVMDNYIQPGTVQTNNILSLQEQIMYINMLANQLPYPSAIEKQIILYKLSGDSVKSNYYANLLAHGFPAFKQDIANKLSALSPIFNDDVAVINNFHYKDQSIFTNKIFKH